MNLMRYNLLDELFKDFWVKPMVFPSDAEPKMNADIQKDKTACTVRADVEGECPQTHRGLAA